MATRWELLGEGWRVITYVGNPDGKKVNPSFEGWLIRVWH